MKEPSAPTGGLSVFEKRFYKAARNRLRGEARIADRANAAGNS
jgi:hypothetical protein